MFKNLNPYSLNLILRPLMGQTIRESEFKVIDQLSLLGAGDPGYEPIKGRTFTPASVRRQSSVKFTSIFLAVVEHARNSKRK